MVLTREKFMDYNRRKWEYPSYFPSPFFDWGSMMRREREYQPLLIKKLERLFPGIIIRKHDIQQGWPDLLLLYGPYWAMLEVKREEPTCAEDFEPNQEWWIEEFNNMSFSACIYPENEEGVLRDLEQAFRTRR